ncbi:MAG: tRNA preQ1(34) S-adenosylmethionine ribosyltransferase-isomerase QueA [Gammaproteobacteria bacterium]|nr:tRNA preQ1(34) S-adenosylmethionine ribosyltransferase-isomerase QueA [Gammaproteobacteria bacterium]
MHRKDFTFDLPKALIARYPASERTGSRLLCLDPTSGQIQHKAFPDVLDFLNPGDLLVLNNTKVMPARIFGEKPSGGKVEILVEKIVDDVAAKVHCRASKRPKIGTELLFEKAVSAKVVDDQGGLLTLEFSARVLDVLSQSGHMPLPPYMERDDEELDKDRYQTVYAKRDGSVAAPTAGLHFDEDLLLKIKQKGINIAYVTLHVGAGTFQPVRVDNLDDHVMHFETAELSQEVCDLILETKKNNKKIIAVGTTSVRVLETAKNKPYYGETNLFIRPGYEFVCVDGMITNFHLPESTLLMLVCALGGYENTMKAYKAAVENNYRFYSYGDAMLISCHPERAERVEGPPGETEHAI